MHLYFAICWKALSVSLTGTLPSTCSSSCLLRWCWSEWWRGLRGHWHTTQPSLRWGQSAVSLVTPACLKGSHGLLYCRPARLTDKPDCTIILMIKCVLLIDRADYPIILNDCTAMMYEDHWCVLLRRQDVHIAHLKTHTHRHIIDNLRQKEALTRHRELTQWHTPLTHLDCSDPAKAQPRQELSTVKVAQ